MRLLRQSAVWNVKTDKLEHVLIERVTNPANGLKIYLVIP